MRQDRIELEVQRKTGFHLRVAFDLPEGGVTVLYGPSGCGKTTVLRSAAGLERALGYVRVVGNVWQDDASNIFVPTYRRRIGYVFQEASLFDHLTVEQNLQFGLRRIPDRDGGKRLKVAVDLLGIGHLLPRRTTQLSGGSVKDARSPVPWRLVPRRFFLTSHWRHWIGLGDRKFCHGWNALRRNCPFLSSMSLIPKRN